jgi:anti-sigma regulatory factor (Ser/Thr protein kinase)
MPKTITKRGRKIRDFLLRNVQDHSADIGKLVQEKFGLSRQSASKYLNDLISEGLLTADGQTRARRYKLRDLANDAFRIEITPNVQEDLEWRNKVRPFLEPYVAPNVLGICNHGFTEMLNNVIDHSGSQTALIMVSRTAVSVELIIRDYGIGIFQKIQQDFALNDPRHALLELSKGKLTSDKTKHSGEGIFFTSRMFDHFSLRSRQLYFARANTAGDWLIEVADNQDNPQVGTCVIMQIAIDSPRQVKEVFDRYSSEFDDYGFTRTHVPIKLGLYDDDQLISRSAAKRLLSRVNNFREVLLDFQDVTSIGQAFADEIFRVFAAEHAEVHLVSVGTNPDIDRMIQRAKESSAPPSQMSLM